MIRQIWGQARHDLTILFRSPASIAAALLPALGMGVLVAVLTNSVGQQPVALVVNDEGRFATRMTQVLIGDSDSYLLKRMTASDAEKAIGEQRVVGIIVIPENFDQGILTNSAIVDLYVNNIDIDFSDDLRRSVTRSVAEFDARQLGLTGEEHGPGQGVLLPNPYRVAIAEHDTRATNVSFLQYEVVPILILIIISTGLLGTGLLTARDFEKNTAKFGLLSPASRASLVMGRILAGVLSTFALVLPLVGIGFLTPMMKICTEQDGLSSGARILLGAPCGWRLSLPSAGNGFALLALLFVVTLATVSWGGLLGILVRKERLVALLGINLAIYLFFLGGGFTTVAFLPDWIQSLSAWVPTRYAIEGLRQALFYQDLSGVGRDILVLAAVGLGSFILSAGYMLRSWRRA